MFLNAEPANTGKERAGDHRLADQALERRFIGLFALEVGGHGVVVEIDRRLDQFLAIFLGLLDHVGRNVDVVIVGAERLVVPHHALHADEVDDALELLLGPDRKLDRDRLGRRARSTMSLRHWKKSAPTLSILLQKTMRGTLYLSPCRQTVSVCGSTP